MSFWELHRSALTAAGLGLFALLVCYFAVIRPASSEADACSQSIAENQKRLAEFYPEVDDPVKSYLPTIDKVHQDCEKRLKEYNQQIKDLKARLRFPFENFPYVTIPEGELPGVYLIHRSNIVARNVETRSLDTAMRGLPGQLEPDWLGFAPSVTPDKVTPEMAQEELRKLCLAEQVTMLAIEAGISRVIKVRPLGKTEEAATHLEPNPRFQSGGKEPEYIPVEYPNRFIVNYPVSMVMIGSTDSVMRFFHKVRQDKQFLVISAFQIISREDKEIPQDVANRMRPGEIYVVISAACMDFKKDEPPPRKGPQYKPPTGPIGA